MTARHEVALLIARKLADSNGRTFHKLSGPQQLKYTEFALEIIAAVEKKMVSQSKKLAELMRETWFFPV